MKRRAVLSAGVGACAAVAVSGGRAWAGETPALRAEDVAAARRMFTHGRYDQPQQRMPALLIAAHGSAMTGSTAAGREGQLLVLASQLAVKQGRIDAAATHADTAVATARRSGRPALLVAAARAAATPLRRTGRTDQALRLLDEARTHPHPPDRRAPHRAAAGRGRNARPGRRLHRRPRTTLRALKSQFVPRRRPHLRAPEACWCAPGTTPSPSSRELPALHQPPGQHRRRHPARRRGRPTTAR